MSTAPQSSDPTPTRILYDGQHLGEYAVAAFIKHGEYNQTYRVTNDNGLSLFMKLFIPSQFIKSTLDDNGKLHEIELYKGLSHPNVIQHIHEGIYSADGVDYPYIVTNYFSGRLLSESISADKHIPVEKALIYYTKILTGLQYLHDNNVVHNDITPRNVMYNPETDEIMIIDMGHIATSGSKGVHFPVEDLSPFFRSPESFREINSPAGDVFSATAVLYAMLCGKAPWTILLDQKNPTQIKTEIYTTRKSPLSFDSATEEIEPWLRDIITGGLSVKEPKRLTIETILQAIQNRESPFNSPTPDTSDKSVSSQANPKYQKSACQEAQKVESEPITKKQGNGFADVAGMDDLKDLLQKKVLFILKNKEKAERYRLTPPNGMLLYGPPGCGKTFFAEKFAEESGFNYKFIKASDLGSIYIHGSQGKIAELFDEARKNAPMIICFDEFDAMVPNRTSRGAENIAGEVNEFLSQLNNCAKDGIFVIGTTNQPSMIDPAVLRKGRIDISLYIPSPDKETRKLMFDLYLKDRPCEEIDTGKLAEMTDNYVASDIAFIVNDAAMIAAFNDEAISESRLIDSIKATRPSLSTEMLKSYDDMRSKIETSSLSGDRPRVGFVQYK